MYQSSARHSHDLGNVLAAPVAAPVGHRHPPLASSGDDQLRVPGRGPLDVASSSLSPTSLLFPLPPPHSLAPSSSSSALLRRPLFSSSSSSGPLPRLLYLLPFLPLLIPPLFPPPPPCPFLHSIFLVFRFFSFFLFCYCLSSSFGLFSFPYPFSLPLRFCRFLLASFLLLFLLLSLLLLVFLLYLPFPPRPRLPLFLHFLSPLPLFFVLWLLLLLPILPPLPPHSSSSSSSGLLPSSALADHQARLLGLSLEYQSLARFLLLLGGTDFAGLVRSSFSHLLPDIALDFASGSSLFLTTLRSVAPPSQAPPPSSVSSSATHPPLSAHLSSASLPGVPPHPSPLAQSHPSTPLVSSSLPPPPGFSHPPSSLAFPIQGSSVVHGLGVGVPSSSGVPPSPYCSSAAPAYGASTSASWHPPSTYPPDPFVSAASHTSANPLTDKDEHYPEDDHVPIDPSAPPLSLDSARSEYCRMIEYICGLFPHAAGVPPSAHPPRALFESFFAPVTPATPSLNFNWFDSVHTALMDADTRVAGLLAAGRPERLLLLQRLASYAVRGDCSLGRAVPVNESLFALTCSFVSRLAMRWRLRPPPGRNQRLSLTQCGCFQTCWGLCACRASPQLILRSLIS